MSRLPHLSLSSLLLGAAALAIGYLVFATARNVAHNYQLHHQESDIRAQIAQLDRDHRQLVAVRDYLKSDEYVEQVARRVLGLTRPGETLVVVSSSDSVPQGTPTPLPARTAGEPWWKELFVQPDAAPTSQPTP